jgi:hypothetical protein
MHRKNKTGIFEKEQVVQSVLAGWGDWWVTNAVSNKGSLTVGFFTSRILFLGHVKTTFCAAINKIHRKPTTKSLNMLFMQKYEILLSKGFWRTLPLARLDEVFYNA